MSALSPIASEIRHRSEVTQGANSDLTRCSRMHRYSITPSARANSDMGGRGAVPWRTKRWFG